MSETSPQSWDHTVDLLVVGSGAGAMTAGLRAHDLGADVLLIEKSLPGGVMVNKKGKRFVNEASPYVDVVKAQYANDTAETPCIPAYLVFDARYRKEYPVGPMLPGAQQPDAFLRGALKRGYVEKANSLAELAQKTGIDAQGLEETVAKMNEYAGTGKDPEFGRGDTVFDTYYGDETVKPNPNLAPIVKPPFYAMECYPGELGTKGGICVDGKARALSESGEVIPGLYAIGNCSAAAMGSTYPGAGATLGPATTFGFIAAEDAVGE
jgi:3-oxosteroid 1-dehydrogenase